MASTLVRKWFDCSFTRIIGSCVNLMPVRYKTHRKFPTRKRINPFVQRRTDLIKRLVLALVQYERIQTTYHKAVQLKKYGDLLVQLSLRRRPPPDLDMIDNGFVLTEKEAREKMIKARIINRMSKRVVIYPQVPGEEEYLVRCRKEASNILLGDRNALEKLYGPLKQRYQDRYGNFVKITRIPNPPNPTFPNMAYVELVDNSLPPLPKMPVVKNGKWVVYGEEEENEETALVQSQ